MLSNMARAPFTASEADGETWYEHVEQYMQYHKARIFEDESTAAAILEEANPMAVRKLGRMVVGFDEDMCSIHIVELFCNSCGVGGLINDAGSCELCMRTATAIPTPSTAAGYLTYNVDEPRS